MKQILLHQCCAVCSPKVVERLSSNFAVTGFFFNPNIYPETEKKNRFSALKEYNESINLNFIINDDCSFLQWSDEIERNKLNSKPGRCEFCYRIRLRKTAAEAKANKIDTFTTTLLVSPYQFHDEIRKTGESVEMETGVKFFYHDFRPYFREGKNVIYNMKLYMQKYCGCGFSMKERKNITAHSTK